MNVDVAAGAKTGVEGLNLLFDAFRQHDKSQTVLISACQGHSLDLTREVLLIRIGDAKFLTTEDQAIGIARHLATSSLLLPAEHSSVVAQFAGALAATVEAVQAEKRTTRVH